VISKCAHADVPPAAARRRFEMIEVRATTKLQEGPTHQHCST